jgi:hypothetical protein
MAFVPSLGPVEACGREPGGRVQWRVKLRRTRVATRGVLHRMSLRKPPLPGSTGTGGSKAIWISWIHETHA